MARRAAQPRYEDEVVEVMVETRTDGTNTEANHHYKRPGTEAKCSLQIPWQLGLRTRRAGPRNTSKVQEMVAAWNQHLCKLEVAEMKCLRAIRGVTRRDRMTNEEVRTAKGCWCGADER